MSNEQRDPEQEYDQDSDSELESEHEAAGAGAAANATNRFDRLSVEIPGMEELLAYLDEARGFDFGGYKRAGLARRLGKRLRSLKLNSFFDYVDYLEVHPNEFANIFNSILINATSFFRDPNAWEFVQRQVVPRLIEARPDNAAIRVWCAGCATGQEAYTAAMVFADELGVEAFARRVKIYATDIDDDALNQARQAMYSPKEISSIPPLQLQAYFERSGARYAFHKELRRSVIFGRHNLFSDAPISKIDLLLCRNTLMYFNAEAQGCILSNLHFALNPQGVLFLGKAEMLLTHSSLFTPLDLKRRLFTKVMHNYPRTRASMTLGLNRNDQQAEPQAERAGLYEALFETDPVVQIVVDMQNEILAANEQARRLLGLALTDIGRPIHDLNLHRKLEGFGASLQQAALERRVIQLHASEWARPNEPALFYDVTVKPILNAESTLMGLQISLLDVTASRRMQDELQRTTRELETAYEELQSTSEELETTNEELQSTVEELETTNEELQSTNEELETTNEELQSTNEELQGMNEELRIRSSELGRVNLYFASILASVRSAVIVLNLELHIEVWSDRAQDLWGLRADEVRGKHFLNLDIGLPIEQLSPAIRACLNGGPKFSEVSIPATNRRGKPIRCAIKLSRLTQHDTVHGVIMLMDEREPSTTAAP